MRPSRFPAAGTQDSSQREPQLGAGVEDLRPRTPDDESQVHRCLTRPAGPALAAVRAVWLSGLEERMHITTPILVTGGTGTLGGQVVPRLREAGCRVRVLSRRSRQGGEGLGPIVAVWLPGRAARAFRAGANLAPDRAVGRRTWEEFLADRVTSPSDSSSSLA
jgi:hypothetical protein